MSAGVDEIMRRRGELIAQCEFQRSDIAMHVDGLDTPIRLADRVLRVCGYLREHPFALGAAIVALALARRRGLLKWGQRAFVVWRTWRAFRGHRNAI